MDVREGLAVGIGAVAGSIVRYILTLIFGTGMVVVLLINSVGCLLIGVAHLSNYFDLTIAIGGAAALSTWPALAAECGHLIKSRQYLTFVGYLVLCLAGGHLAAFLGTQIPSFW
ncbi:MAG: CrcB family protein [Corynebacterium sp.]|nr:CrcB family protein [Corynebacterium sp.]